MVGRNRSGKRTLQPSPAETPGFSASKLVCAVEAQVYGLRWSEE